MSTRDSGNSPANGEKPSRLPGRSSSAPNGSSDELRPVTALFADIVGSTALGELLAMEEVKALVGECVSRICEVVERHDGVVGAYMGDGVAAFFGLDAAGEDDSLRAAIAALEIRRVVNEYAMEAEGAWGVQNLTVRIGINAGRVATGPVGASNPQVLALGDSVNVAARLQGFADPGSIVVGASVARALVGRFEVLRLGSLELKGRAKQVNAFVLVAEVPGDHRLVRSAFVGRDSEIAQLQETLDDLSTGRGQITLILGEAGIGKTRLLDEARRRSSTNILWLGACSNADDRMPYAPFVDVLRTWLGLEVGAPDIAVRVRLQAKLRELMGVDGDPLVAGLSRMMGVRARTKEDRRLDGLPAEVSRRNLHGAYLRWLTALARSVPVALAIDNFGRADESTVQLTEEVLAITDAAPLLVMLTMRPDSSSGGWKVRVHALAEFTHRSDELRLQPLSGAESSILLDALDGSGVVVPAVRSTLIERAEGNPLYMEELFHAVAGDPQHEALTPAEGALPPVLEGILLARIDQLPTDARTLLQAAAVLGREFSRQVLDGMHVADDLEAALSLLLRADLIRERRRDPAEYAFKHGLLREAALSTLTRHRQGVLHGCAAQAIENSGVEMRERVPELAWHHLISGNVEKAVTLLEEFGDRLASVYRFEQAIEVLEDCRRQLNARGSGEEYRRVARKLAELRARTGDSQGATALIDELAEEVGEAPERSQLLVLKAQLLAELGDLEGAGALLEQCEQGALDERDAHRVLALSAQLALRRQDLREARRCLEQLGDVDELTHEIGCECASLWAGYLATIGDFVAAKTWGEHALALAQRVGRANLELRTSRQLGVLQILNGFVRSGHALVSEVFDRCSELGFTIGSLESGINVVHSAYLLGNVMEAKAVSLNLLELTKSPFWEAFVRSNLSMISLETNDLDGAESAARRVLEIGAEITSPAPRIPAMVVLARVHATKSEWESAQAELARAEAEAKPLAGRGGSWLSLRIAMGELAWQRGDWETASIEVEALFAQIEYAEKPIHVPALRLKGLAMSRVDRSQAMSILENAYNMSRVMEMRLEEAYTLVAMHSVNSEATDEALERARSIFSSCKSERGLQLVAERAKEARTSHGVR